MTSAAHSGTGFFSLPGEIRNQIYQYIGQDGERNRRLVYTSSFLFRKSSLQPRIPPIMQVSREVRQECGVFFTDPRALESFDYPAVVQWINGLGQPMIHNLISLKLRVDVKVRKLGASSPPRLCHLYIWYSYWRGFTGECHRFYLDYDFARALGAVVQQGECNLIIVPAKLPQLVTDLTDHFALTPKFSIPDLIALIEWLRNEEITVCPVGSIDQSISFKARANSFLARDRYGKRTVIPARRRLIGGVWY